MRESYQVIIPQNEEFYKENLPPSPSFLKREGTPPLFERGE